MCTSIQTQTTNLDIVSRDEVDDFPITTIIPTPIQLAQTPLTKSIAYHLLRLRQNNNRSLDQSVKQTPSLLLRRRIANDLGFQIVPPYALASPMDPRSPLIIPRTPFDLNAIEDSNTAPIQSDVQGTVTANRKLNISNGCNNDEESDRADEPCAERRKVAAERSKLSTQRSKLSTQRSKLAAEQKKQSVEQRKPSVGRSKLSVKNEVTLTAKSTNQTVSRLPRAQYERPAWSNSIRNHPTRRTNRRSQQEEVKVQATHSVDRKTRISKGDDKEHGKENKEVQLSVESEERPTFGRTNQNYSRLPKAIEQLKIRRDSKLKRIKKSSQHEEPGLLVTPSVNPKPNISNSINAESGKAIKEIGLHKIDKKINQNRRANTELELTRAHQAEGKRIKKSSQQEEQSLLSTYTTKRQSNNSNGIDQQKIVVENGATTTKKRANQNVVQPKTKYDQIVTPKIEEKKAKKVSRQEEPGVTDTNTANRPSKNSNGIDQQKGRENEEIEQSEANKRANRNGLEPKTKYEQMKTPKIEEKKAKKVSRQEEPGLPVAVAVNRELNFPNGDEDGNGVEIIEIKPFSENEDASTNQNISDSCEQTKQSQSEEKPLEKNNQKERLDLPDIPKTHTVNRMINISIGHNGQSETEDGKAKATTENENNSTAPKNEQKRKQSNRSVHIYLSAKNLLRSKEAMNGRMPLSLISQTGDGVEKTPTRSQQATQEPKSASRIPVFKK